MAQNIRGIPFDLPKLPTPVDYTTLFDDLRKANSALTRLDEMLKHLPDPSRIERIFLSQEAVLSSKIEGTQVTLEEVLKEEADNSGKPVEEISERGKDIKEIINYRQAFIQGLKIIENGELLTEDNVKKLHKILLRSVRGKTRAPGEFRRDQVYIAPPGTPMKDARYVPPSPIYVPDLYGNFDQYLNKPEAERDPLVQIAIAHYQFEAIHPFNDGNGRLGRLLIPLFLFQRKIVARPLMYVSKYFEAHRSDYYDLLAAVSYKNEWTAWIRFFLHGLFEHATHASTVGRNIIALQEKLRKGLSKFQSPYALNFLDAMFTRSYFTPTAIKQAAGLRNQQTALNLIRKFELAGIIRDVSPERKRNKIYEFTLLVKLLRERNS
ncbi:MAG: Fic family protein [Patescibacteria group bacterium]